MQHCWVVTTVADWRYLYGRGVVHAVTATMYGHSGPAVCGVEPRLLADWFGTGSQQEYERVAALPCCRRCVAKVGEHRG